MPTGVLARARDEVQALRDDAAREVAEQRARAERDSRPGGGGGQRRSAHRAQRAAAASSISVSSGWRPRGPARGAVGAARAGGPSGRRARARAGPHRSRHRASQGRAGRHRGGASPGAGAGRRAHRRRCPGGAGQGQPRQQAKRDSALIVRDIEAEARDEGEERARRIVTLAIQRVASEQTAESVVSRAAPAERRHEGPDHRPRGPQHPRLRGGDRRQRRHR